MIRIRLIARDRVRQFSSAAAAEKKRLVIVGGVAGGATAAARLNRLTNDFDVTIVERSPDVSFANCGLPYFIGGEIRDRSKLALQTPQSLQAQLGVAVRVMTEAIAIKKDQKLVEVRDIRTGQVSSLPYDKLLLSPGASPIRPPLPNIHLPQIHTLRNLQDMDRIASAVKQMEENPKSERRVVVVGGGFIGLEVAEQLRHRHCKVTLVERAEAVLPQADVDMASFLHTPLQEHGVALVTGDGLAGFEPLADGEVSVRLSSGKTIVADAVILSIGVQPESGLGRDAGLRLSERGYIQVNEFMQTSDPDVYAVGDVVETRDFVFPDRRATVALGNLANMQARVAADHLVYGADPARVLGYAGSLGTSIVRAFDTTLALTGWTEKRLRQAGIAYSSTVITAFDHASYYPDATPVTLKLTFCPTTGRVFGGQAVGVAGVDKRIDVVATAISGGMTVDALSQLQLCYAPPFGSARDVVNVAGLAARNSRDRLVHASTAMGEAALSGQRDVVLLDVRPRESAQLSPIAGSVNVPYKEVRGRLDELRQRGTDVEFRTICAWGKTAYFASRELEKAGLQTSTLIGGLQLHRKPLPDLSIDAQAPPAGSEPLAEVKLDCSGMACPGPLLKLRESIASLPAQSALTVKATDPGFKADVRAFAASNGLTVESLTSSKGVITATLRKAAARRSEEQPSGATEAALDGRRKGATVVVFSEEFDKVLAAFVIANGAAAMGGPVTMFFTFWGLNALKTAASTSCGASPGAAAGGDKDLMDRLFSAMLPAGPDRLPLSHFNFGGLGATMMKQVMQKKHLPNLPGLLQAAQQQHIRLVACTMSMEAMGVRPEELLPGVEFGGVADYLSAAEKSGTNLFI